MGDLEGAAFPCPGRVAIADLIPTDGLPSERYKTAVAVLAQSLARYNFAIVQLPLGDDVLVKCVLDSARMFFHQRPSLCHNTQRSDQQDWNRTAGYFAEPHHVCEVYDYRPGYLSESADSGYSPVGLPELFASLGRASRHLLDAIGRSLDLRSFSFADMLDNVPLKIGEISSSVLSVCCHGRPGAHASHLTGAVAGSDQGTIPMFDDHEPHSDKGLLSLMKSDKPGLRIKDMHGRWLIVDGELGPQDMILYTGLMLYQTTAGYVTPAFHQTQVSTNQDHGRCSISFKLMAKPSAILHCAAMTAAGHGVSSPFQQSIAVHDFMQTACSIDQVVHRPTFANYCFQPASDEVIKPVVKRKRPVHRGKPLAPSKRLRLEAQRVLKERVQEIADRKGIKIRFCSLRDCEVQHISNLESPCASVRAQIGWPAGVPFVHPHDLPNKAKQAFLEAYEPGWTASQDGDLGLVDSGHTHMQALHYG